MNCDTASCAVIKANPTSAPLLAYALLIWLDSLFKISRTHEHSNFTTIDWFFYWKFSYVFSAIVRAVLTLFLTLYSEQSMQLRGKKVLQAFVDIAIINHTQGDTNSNVHY
jgi:hypothetical protein